MSKSPFTICKTFQNTKNHYFPKIFAVIKKNSEQDFPIQKMPNSAKFCKFLVNHIRSFNLCTFAEILEIKKKLLKRILDMFSVWWCLVTENNKYITSCCYLQEKFQVRRSSGRQTLHFC